eukprot:6739462-Karenia_brevis.AAC.1
MTAGECGGLGLEGDLPCCTLGAHAYSSIDAAATVARLPSPSNHASRSHPHSDYCGEEANRSATAVRLWKQND